MRHAATHRPRPAVPSNIFTKSVACLTAIFREATYGQYTATTGFWSRFQIPPAGTILLLISYFGWIMLWVFVDNDVAGAQHYTALGVRAAWLAVAQVPLLILLAGKNNLIGMMSGISYERLNVLHRWVSRGLLLLATLHVAFIHTAWNAYDLGPLEYATDSCVPTGWATYAILIWMNISTLPPIRNFSYEFFVVQHIITFIGFIVAVMYHLPSTALYSRVYIYIPIGLYFVDRLLRTARYAYNNSRPARASLLAMEGGLTKISIRSNQIKTWTPGSHVFLAIPKFGIGQSHPATIASIPTSHDGELIFLLKSRKGFTSRLHDACGSTASLVSRESPNVTQIAHISLLDGPYGKHADFAAFDSILLIAGSTGITFTLPLLLDVANRVRTFRLPVRRVQFLWIVKNTSWTTWVSSELESAFVTLQAAGIEVQVKVHVTCDDNFTSNDDGQPSKACDCACDQSLGPCCCVNVEEDERITPISEYEGSGANAKMETEKINPSDDTSPFSGENDDGAIKNRILPCALFYSGRPNIKTILERELEQAEGETGVAVCGPLGLNSEVRRCVVKLSDERAVHKGTGAQGIFLHAESYGW